MQFGSQTTPPVLQFELLAETSGLGLSAHNINGDVPVPEVIYEVLTNTLWGLGLDPDLIDTASFVSVAEALIAEGVGISPVFDSAAAAREILGKLYEYGDVFLYWHEGRIHCGISRWSDPSALPVLDEGDLLEEPRLSNGLFSDTWNYTLVNFEDRETDREGAVETYEDAANFAVVEERVQKEVDLPHVSLRAVAKVLARRIGIRGGVPRTTYDLTLKPSWRTLKPGDRFKLTYSRLGIAAVVCRVEAREIQGPENMEVRIEAVEDETRVETADYVVGSEEYKTSIYADENGNDSWTLTSTTPRLLWLPDGLKPTTTPAPSGVPDGFLCAMHHPTGAVDGATVHFTWNPVASSYRELTMVGAFPAKGTLVSWHRIRTDSWIFRVLFDSQEDYDQAALLCQDGFPAYLVSARRLVRLATTPTDQHQCDGIWAQKVQGGYAMPAADLMLDIEVQDNVFDSVALAFETSGAAGSYPCEHVYFGRLEDFALYPSSSLRFEDAGGNAPVLWDGSTSTDPDADRKRYVKATTFHARAEQAVVDVTATVYDRNDTTMCPDGTYSVTWGDYAPTLYELFDILAGGKALGGSPPGYSGVQDVDEALWRMFYGAGTAADFLLLDSLDYTLGGLVLWPRGYYNPVAE